MIVPRKGARRGLGASAAIGTWNDFSAQAAGDGLERDDFPIRVPDSSRRLTVKLERRR